MTYDGVRPIKNPRGSITPHRFPNGQIALTFYNNGRTEREGYVGRRLYWLTVGTPTDKPHRMEWSEPELLLWWDGEALDDRPDWNADWAIVDGPGYPDFCEASDGKLCFVQSNKLTLRFHTVDPRTLWLLRRQQGLSGIVRENLRVNVLMPRPDALCRGFNLGDLRARAGGFTIVVQLRGQVGCGVRANQVLCDATEITTAALDEEDGGDYITKGFEIRVKGRADAGLQLQLLLSDGFVKSKHATDGLVWDGESHVVTFTVDSGPRLLTCLVDGRLCDGGVHAPEGFHQIDAKMSAIGGADMRLLPNPTTRRPHAGRFGGEFINFLIYNRPLLTSEAIAVARALQANPAAAAKGSL